MFGDYLKKAKLWLFAWLAKWRLRLGCSSPAIEIPAFSEEDEMALVDHVIALVEELDRTHPGGVADWNLLPRGELPNMATAQNGQVRLFTPVALKELAAIANLLYDNDVDWKKAAERSVFHDQLRRCVVDLHAEGHFAHPRIDDARDARKQLRERLKRQLAAVAATYVHHIPCWTAAVLPSKDFVLGPVTLRTVHDWIDWVDFQPQAYTYGTPQAKEANKEWRRLLKESLATGQYNTDKRPEGFAGYLDRALSQCPAMATVAVTGYEPALSKKVAHAVCQAALDCVGLALGQPDTFVFQILGSGRVEPFLWTSIVGTPHGLGFPGFAATRRLSRLDPVQTRERLVQATPLLTQQAAMLTSLLQPSAHAHPQLASRWLTALQWLADGHREQDDAIAVAKLGSALDTLACGGKAGGITDLLENLLGKKKEDPLIKGPRGVQNLGQVVKDIYDFGRSQILHGTHYERLKRFEELRELALLVVPPALVESAMRLGAYAGPDTVDTVFRTMGPGGSPLNTAPAAQPAQ
jgi:hypothetical protein